MIDCHLKKSNEDKRDDFKIPDNDPALWSINNEIINFFLLNQPKQNIESIDFNTTKRLIGKYIRHLPIDIFKRKMQNGETIFRDWILYSKLKNALFCFHCLLFGECKTSFGNQNEGFINWKNCYEKVSEHEKSPTHVKSIKTWYLRLSNTGHSGLDNIIKKEIADSLLYWKNVLHRIVETLKFLTSRGLAIRGINETLGSVHNGNYLGCLELIAKFDPFINQHLSKYGNKGRGNVSYISSTICTEFIMIMSETVIKEIVNQIQSRKYFSIIVDSTPDVTRVDQLTIAIRYVINDGTPVERFIGFLPSVGHKGENMEKAIIDKFTELNINIKDCRGQAYDNTSNMSGIYNGLQSRIKCYSSTAEFIPCSAHSLNLVGSNAAESTSVGTQFFYIAQAIYNFFSVSTYRWELLCNNNKDNIHIKKLCTTRWSSRYDVCKALSLGYKQIKLTLEKISKDSIQKKETRHEASSILNKIDTLDFTFMICMWTPILKRFNVTSLTLQSTTIDLSIVTNLYESLVYYIKDMRNNFNNYLLEAQEMSGIKYFSSTTSRKKKRVVFLDENSTNEVTFNGEEKMKNDVFYVILDHLISDLNIRKLSYSNINQNFGIFLNLEKEKIDTIKKCAENLVKLYSQDIENDFIEELVQFKAIICNFDVKQKSSIINILKTIISKQLIYAFPNIEIALRIFCSFPCSNASGERSFSVLKRVKNYLRSSLANDKLSALSILCVENDILENIDWTNIIHTFATGKVMRRKEI